MAEQFIDNNSDSENSMPVLVAEDNVEWRREVKANYEQKGSTKGIKHFWGEESPQKENIPPRAASPTNAR